MKKLTLFAFALLFLTSSAFVYAGDGKKANAGKSDKVTSAGENSGLLTEGALGFKFYSGYPFPLSYTGSKVSFFRTIGAAIDYHITSSIAIEPGFFYCISDIKGKNDSWASDTKYNDPYYGPSLGLYYYYNTGTDLYIYSGPRAEFAYHHEKETKNDASTAVYSEYYYGASAVLGLKYMFSENFGVFGEMGLGFFIYYKHSKDYNPLGIQTEDARTTEKQVSFSSAFFGVAFYL